MKHYLVALFLFGLSVSGFAQTQCSAFPCVVATVTLTNQSQAIPSTPFFTPAQDGMFRMNVYLSTTASTNKGAYCAVFAGWTDENGSRKWQSQANQNNSNAGYSSSFVVRDLGGQPLLYQTKPNQGQGTGMTYELFITVEQLQ
jgi:hypothetical protein